VGILVLKKWINNTKELFYNTVWAFILKSHDPMDERRLTFHGLHGSQYDF